MKKFLKPTKNKIFLSIGIALLNIATAIYSASAVLCTQGCKPANIIQEILSLTIQPFIIIKFFTEFFEDFSVVPEIIGIILTFVMSGIILFFFWYLVSCIIVKLFTRK